MKRLLDLYSWIHAAIAALFGMTALMLIVIAARVAWSAFTSELDAAAAEIVIEAMGLLAAAVVALQISQTIAEEEVIRYAQISAPTRVRRFLSRFMVVIVVAVAVEALVATFKAREHPELLLYAAATLTAVGIVLAAWGLFVRLNRYAEELEPEAMEEAKREDAKLR
jgi:hypothetical protein